MPIEVIKEKLVEVVVEKEVPVEVVVEKEIIKEVEIRPTEIVTALNNTTSIKLSNVSGISVDEEYGDEVAELPSRVTNDLFDSTLVARDNAEPEKDNP